MVRLVAQCGGFLTRKGDSEPGAKMIWEGLQHVMTATKRYGPCVARPFDENV
ncbi:MAG: IS4 family transposase [Burkholderia sp.]